MEKKDNSVQVSALTQTPETQSSLTPKAALDLLKDLCTM